MSRHLEIEIFILPHCVGVDLDAQLLDPGVLVITGDILAKGLCRMADGCDHLLVMAFPLLGLHLGKLLFERGKVLAIIGAPLCEHDIAVFEELDGDVGVAAVGVCL